MISKKALVFPKQIANDEYEKVRTFLVNTLKNFDDVLGIYEFGKVTVAGISDLDFAIVLRNQPANKKIGEEVAKIEFSEVAKEILCGSTLMVFCEKHFPQITIWDDVDVSRLWGKTFKLTNFNQDTVFLLTVCQIMDWLPERILSLLRLSQKESISVAGLLGHLHSLRFTFRKIEQLGIPSYDKLKQYNNDIVQLRKSWFSMKGQKRVNELVRLFDTAIDIGRSCLLSVAQWLTSKRYYLFRPGPEELGSFHLTEDMGYKFLDLSSYMIRLNETAENFVNHGVLLPVPAVWAFHLKTYASLDGIISRKLRQTFSIYPSIPAIINPKLLSILHRRMTLCNEMAEFLGKYKFRSGLFKFGWFYK
jgi:hypothetical protein